MPPGAIAGRRILIHVGYTMTLLTAADRDLLARAELFRGLPAAVLDRIAADFLSARLAVSHPAGTVLLARGCANDSLFIVLDGTLEVFIGNDLPGHHLALGPGQSVGEMSLMDGHETSATVIAASDCRLLQIPQDKLWPMMQFDPLLARNVMHVLTSRIRAVNRALVESLQNQRALESEARIDGLTGVFNRRWIDAEFARSFEACLRGRQPVSLIMVDLDNFKQLNDRHGHLSGDDALRRFARTLTSQVRATDIVGRYGGEEFAILLPETGAAAAAGVAERLRQSTAEVAATGADGQPLSLTASFGVASHRAGDPPCTLRDLLQCADGALYAAKAAGRNRVVIG
jgi:diguanylate cyclase (GGDEF)-like protein